MNFLRVYLCRFAVRAPPNIFSSFSRQRGFIGFYDLVASPSRLSIPHAYFTTCLNFRLDALFHPRAPTILLCHCFIYAFFGGTGISTRWSSCTPFGLHLDPDLPWADEPSPGNLRLSTERFLASLSLLMPAFSLLYSPRLLSVSLPPV